MSLAIGLLGKKWRARAAFNEKIFVRIAYNAFCLQEVGSQVMYLLAECGRTKKMFDVMKKYEMLPNQNLGYRDNIQNITGSLDSLNSHFSLLKLSTRY